MPVKEEKRSSRLFRGSQGKGHAYQIRCIDRTREENY